MDLVIVSLIVGAAVIYVGRKAWRMFQPGAKAGGCSSCGTAKSGCANCPLVKR